MGSSWPGLKRGCESCLTGRCGAGLDGSIRLAKNSWMCFSCSLAPLDGPDSPPANSCPLNKQNLFSTEYLFHLDPQLFEKETRTQGSACLPAQCARPCRSGPATRKPGFPPNFSNNPRAGFAPSDGLCSFQALLLPNATSEADTLPVSSPCLRKASLSLRPTLKPLQTSRLMIKLVLASLLFRGRGDIG